MPFDPATAYLASAGIGAATGSISAYSGAKTNDANIGFQRQTNIENADMMYKAWNREDNAVVRRVQDLQNAGLSPVLAAGQGASSSSPIKMDAPRSENYAGMAVGNAVQAALGFSQLAKTNADIHNVNANTSKTETDELAVNQSMDQELIMNNFKSKAISAQTFQSQMEALRKKYELERDKKFGLGEKSTPLSRQVQDAGSAVDAVPQTPGEKQTARMTGKMYVPGVGYLPKIN